LRVAVYPGSFDPMTFGHLDIVDRARCMFDKIYVAISINSAKKTLFTMKERSELTREVLKERKDVEVVTFEGLLTDFARDVQATAIVRGIRAVTDFDYEYAIYQVNRQLNPDVDTVFLLASQKYSFISSTIIKEVARYGKSLSEYAPPTISEALLKKFGHMA
jgi:pantetheine-phosphate adenylyltransferase